MAMSHSICRPADMTRLVNSNSIPYIDYGHSKLLPSAMRPHVNRNVMLAISPLVSPALPYRCPITPLMPAEVSIPIIPILDSSPVCPCIASSLQHYPARSQSAFGVVAHGAQCRRYA